MTGIPTAARDRAAAEFERLTSVAESELAPPFGVIDVPAENAVVEAGSWGYGWALDDSGISRIEVETEAGPASPALIGQAHPGIPEVYTEYPANDRAGFGFVVPRLAAGPHTLKLRVVGRVGGVTILVRRVRLR